MVNDSAEPGVKISSDFLAAVHSEKHYQNYLQVVEQDRKKKKKKKKQMYIKKNIKQRILNKNLTSLLIQNGCFNLHTHKG